MTHKLTRLAALVLAVIMAFSVLLVPASAASFNDVSGNAWYKAAVDYVQERGWMAGVSETSFAPNKEVTRGMMVTVLARVAGAETNNDTAAFTDTTEGKWYTGAAAWAAENGIVSGVGSGLFAPNRAITRQDLCVMLYKYVTLMGYELRNDIDRTFSDMESVSDYARDAVIYCTGTGLVSGFEDSSFRPKDTATRAQVAQLMMRLDLLIKEGTAPTDPMPAQSFDGEAGEDMTVSVNAPEGALPEDTNMSVSRVTDEAALSAIAAKVSGELLAAADITFSKDGSELEPASDVEVQISLDGLENVANPKVAHVKADGSVEIVSAELVNATRGSAKALRFLAKDFSIYAIFDGNEDENARLLIQFWNPDFAANGSYTLQKGYSVYVTRRDINNSDGEGGAPFNWIPTIVADPGIPQPTGDLVFSGWTFNSDYTDLEVDGQHTIEYIRDGIHDYLADSSNNIVDGETVLNVYPMIFYFYTVTYMDEIGDTAQETRGYYSRTAETTVPINCAYDPYNSEYTHIGWMRTDNGQNYKKVDTMNISGSVVLRARVATGYWITFVENPGTKGTYKGATYVPPVFCPEGEIPDDAQPNRDGMKLTGYTFDDWYQGFTEGTGSNPDSWSNKFTFEGTIDRNVTVYAKWNQLPTAKYTVIVWKQSVNDDKGFTDDQKTYDYAFSFSAETASGTAISALPLTSYTQLSGNKSYNFEGETYSFLGFKYNTTRGLKTTGGETAVKSNGSTVVNIYYNRELVTFRFYAPNSYGSGYSSTANPEMTGLYGQYLSKYGYSWPTTYWWKEGTSASNITNTRTTFLAQFLITNAQGSMSVNYYGYSGTTSATVYWYTQNLDGTWKEEKNVTSGNGGFYLTDKFDGFQVVSYSTTTNTDSAYTNCGTTLMDDGDDGLAYDALPNTSAFDTVPSGYSNLYIRNKRLSYGISYNLGAFYDGDGNPITDYTYAGSTHFHDETGILYEAELDYYAKDKPGYYDPVVDGKFTDETFVFVGWYTTPSCTAGSEFTFTKQKMPLNGLLLYAKFVKLQYRVFLIDNAPDGITVQYPENQDPDFRRNYQDLISNGQRIELTDPSDNYALVGWYLDEALTQPFSFNTQVTDAIAEPYPDSEKLASDLGRPWITKKITLYAKWRRVLNGSNGIHVRYNADYIPDNVVYHGAFADGTTVWEDGQVYADGATVIARSASVAGTKNYEFLYWEILDKDGNGTGQYVYPGGEFTLHVDDASSHEASDHEHVIEFVDAVAPTCEDTGLRAHYRCTVCGLIFTDAAGTNETTEAAVTIAATGHDWGTPTYEWDENDPVTCVATAVCENDPTHVLTETATLANGKLTFNVDVPATTDTEGQGTYTADFDSEDLGTSTHQVTLPAVSNYTVTYSVAYGTAPASQDVEPNTSIALPTVEAPAGYTFLGWVDADVAETDVAPTFYSGFYTVNSNKDFKALYAHDVLTAAYTAYELVTSAPSNWANDYVITAGPVTAVLTGISGTTSYESTTVGGTTRFADTGIVYDSEKNYLRSVDDKYVFTIAASGTGYSIRNKDTQTYLRYYSNTTSYYLYSDTSLNTNYGLWTFAMHAADGYGIDVKNGFTSTASNNFYIAYLSGPFFGLNIETSENIYLWAKKDVEEKTTYYSTEIATYTVSYSVPAGATAPASQQVLPHGTVTLPAAPANSPAGYTFLGWVEDSLEPTTQTQTYIETGDASDEIVADTTFYALYSYLTDVHSETAYQLVTSSLSDWSGNYVITYGVTTSMSVMKGMAGSADGTQIESSSNYAAYAASGVTLTDDKLTNVANDYLFQIAKSGDYYSVKSVSQNTYLGKMSSNGYLASYSSLNTTYCLWTPGYNSTNASSMYSSSGTSYPYLGYSSYFYTSSSANTSVRFWKETTVTTGTTYYTTQISGGSSSHEHSYGSWSPNNNGTHSQTCSDCGSVETVDCTYTNVITQPTETSTGYTTHTCDVCGYSYTDETTYRVNFSVPSGVGQTETYRTSNRNTGDVTLPTESNLSNIPSGYTFCGWITDSSYQGTTEPTGLMTDYYHPTTNNVTLYAVFSSSSGSGTTWEKATSIAAGDIVVIVYETTGYELTAVESNIGVATSYTGTPNGTYPLTVVTGAISGTFAFKNGSNYLSLNSAANRLNTSTTLDEYGKSSWTVSISNGTATIKNNNYDRYLQFNTNTNQQRFCCYTNTMANPQIYKQTSGTTTWTTSFPSGSGSVTEPVAQEGKPVEIGPETELKPFEGQLEPELTETEPETAGVNAVDPADPVTATTGTWVETDEIVTGVNYLIGIKYGDAVYLIMNYNPTASGDARYYYTYTSGSNSYYLGYVSSASVNSNGYIDGVSGYSNDFTNCSWQFSSASGGTVTSAQNSSYYLYDANGPLAYTSATTWIWDATNHRLAEDYYNSNTYTTSRYYVGLTEINGQYYTASNTSTDYALTIGLYRQANAIVTFNANGGEGTMTDQAIFSGSALNANAFTRSGYTFAGWNTAADGTGTAYPDGAAADFSSNVTLYAQWRQEAAAGQAVTFELASSLQAGEDYVIVIGSYAVGNAHVSNNRYFNAQSVTVNSDNTITVPSDKVETVLWHVTGANNTTVGFSFLNLAVNKFIGLKTDDSYYPGLTDTSPKWTYDGTDLNNNCTDSGNYSSSSSTYYYYLAPRSPASTGFTVTVTSGQNVKVYKRVIDTANCVVTFNANGGSGTMANQTVPYNEETALNDNAFTRANYDFDGWNTRADGTGTAYADGATVTLRENITLYAQWVPTVTVTFNANGGNGTMAAQAVRSGVATALNVNAFTKDGYSFKYWTTAADGTGTKYEDQQIVNITENLTLYAQWDQEIWYPAKTVVTGAEYLIGYKDGSGNVILLMNYNPDKVTSVGTNNNENYSYVDGNSDTYAYGIVAVLDANGNVTGVSNTTYANATLENATWVFEKNGEYLRVRSGYEGDHYLRVASNPNRYNDLMPADDYLTSSNNWKWDKDNKNLTYTAGNLTRYVTYVQNRSASNLFNAPLSATANSQLQLYSKTAATFDVTFVDGQDNDAEIEVQEVTVHEDAVAPNPPLHSGFLFDHWEGDMTDVDSDRTVRAIYVESDPFTVTFLNEDGTVLTTKQVPASDFVNTEGVATPTKEGYIFKEWQLNGVRFYFETTPITADITLRPAFTKAEEITYTITLRAVYGPKRGYTTTHVTWYADNGYTDANGDYHDGYNEDSETVVLNNKIVIKDPTGDENFYNPGYKFIGWARLNESADSISAGHTYVVPDGCDYVNEYTDLTEDDLWLKYFPADPDNGHPEPYFMVNISYGTAAAPVWRETKYIAANENYPYHGLYAVWEARTTFYVLHSATGRLEAYDIPISGASGGSMISTFPLSDLVSPGYVYGGYYKDYGGIDDKALQDKITSSEIGMFDPTLTGWTTASEVSVNGTTFNKRTYETASDADLGFVSYDGSSLTNGRDRFWTKTDAYNSANGDDPGNALHAKAGVVYYIKEVPADYLTSKVVYTTDKSQDNVIIDAYMLTVTDDRYYSNLGFIHAATDNGANIGTEITGYDAIGGAFNLYQGDIAVLRVAPADFGLTRGYVAVTNVKSYATNASTFTMQPVWVTLDGVNVYNDAVTYSFVSTTVGESQVVTGMSWARAFTGNDTFYVKMTSSWTTADPLMKAYVYNDSDNAWITLTKTSTDGVYSYKIPKGKWNGLIFCRCNPNMVDDQWWWNSNDFAGIWNKSGNINLVATLADSTKNPAGSKANIITWFADDLWGEGDNEKTSDAKWGLMNSTTAPSSN